VLEMTGSKSQIVRRPLPPDDPSRRRPDITLAKKHLDWSPAVPLEQGLQQTIDYFQGIDLSNFRPPTPNYT
jgi:UDP-glucuronate decarboxylase